VSSPRRLRFIIGQKGPTSAQLLDEDGRDLLDTLHVVSLRYEANTGKRPTVYLEVLGDLISIDSDVDAEIHASGPLVSYQIVVSRDGTRHAEHVPRVTAHGPVKATLCGIRSEPMTTLPVPTPTIDCVNCTECRKVWGA